MLQLQTAYTDLPVILQDLVDLLQLWVIRQEVDFMEEVLNFISGNESKITNYTAPLDPNDYTSPLRDPKNE